MDNRLELLEKWEEVYKKGLLTFWLLLILDEQSAYPYEMSEALRNISQNSISADEKSIYRALSRFEKLGMVRSEMKGSSIGPSRRYYSLTQLGVQMLADFIRRNIRIFEDPQIVYRMQVVMNRAEGEDDTNDHN
jgi:PadR family transcriptional regulator, regulatory protein PadR